LPSFEPHVELLKKLHTNWIVGSSKYVCEGYTMSNRVDIKIQSKVKYLEANLMRICLSWIQEGAGEAKRCAHQGGDQIQFRIPEFDFEPNSGSRTTSPSN
jgi:hypothetical protein